MLPFCYPFYRQLIPVYNAIRHIEFQIRHGKHTGPLALHDGYSPHEWMRIHAVFNDSIFMIILMQLLNIAR